MTQYMPGDPYYPFEKPGPDGKPKPGEPVKPKPMGLLSKLTMGFLGMAMLTGVSYGASHEENWERTRLTEQPGVGKITENVVENDFIEKCDDDNSYTYFVTTEGLLFFKVDKQVPPYVNLNEDGTIKKNPFVFLKRSTRMVYVNIDGDKNPNQLFDFEQTREKQPGPCNVLTNLDNYVVKDLFHDSSSILLH